MADTPFTDPPPHPFTEQALAAASRLFPYDEATSFAAATTLRAQGFTPEEAAQVLNLVKSRTRATAKFGAQARTLLLTEDALEQATRAPVAAYHARRLYHAVQLPHPDDRHWQGSVADLGCGIGADALAFAAAGLACVAIERDAITASYAAYNLSADDHARVLVGDVRDYEHGSLCTADGSPVQGLWLDPARRHLTGVKKAQTERIADPQLFSPPLSFVLDLARTGAPMGVKFGPGIDHTLIPTPQELTSEANPHPRVEAQWVEHEGTVVELVLWFNGAARQHVTRAATVLDTTGQVANELVSAEPVSGESARDSIPAQVPLPVAGGYIYEPSGAVIRAHLVQDFAAQVGAHLIDSRIAYLGAAHPLPAGSAHLGSCYRVLEQVPTGEKQLKRWVRERNITALTIKKRGVDLVPEKLRATLLAGRRTAGKGKRTYNPATLIFMRLGEGRDARRIGWSVQPVKPAQ